MARSSPRTWVYNELVTAAIMNTHIRDQQDAYWPYTTAGDIPYATAGDTIARLAVGTAGQGLRTNNAGTTPEYANVMLDWEELTVADWVSTAVAAYQVVTDSTITLTLPVPGVVFSIVTCNISTDTGATHTYLRTYIDADAGDLVQTLTATEYWEVATATHMKACAAGNIDCDIRSFASGAVAKSRIRNIQITAWAIPGA